MFEQMRDNYGVNIPDINIVIGENNGGERVVFMVVDKIAGENLNNPEILNNSELFKEIGKEKLEDFYTKILQFMLDAYKEGDPFPCDFSPRNIAYGHKNIDKNTGAKKDLFLLDVGNSGFVYNGKIDHGDGKFTNDGTQKRYDEAFFSMLPLIIDQIEGYEMELGEEVRMSLARDKVKEMFEYVKSNRNIDEKYFNDVFKRSICPFLKK